MFKEKAAAPEREPQRKVGVASGPVEARDGFREERYADLDMLARGDASTGEILRSLARTVHPETAVRDANYVRARRLLDARLTGDGVDVDRQRLMIRVAGLRLSNAQLEHLGVRGEVEALYGVAFQRLRTAGFGDAELRRTPYPDLVSLAFHDDLG